MNDYNIFLLFVYYIIASEPAITTLDAIYDNYKSRKYRTQALHTEYNTILTELISYLDSNTNILKEYYMKLYVISYLLYGTNLNAIMQIVYVQQVIFWFKMLNITTEIYERQNVTPINNKGMHSVVMDSFMLPTYKDNILKIMDREQTGIRKVSNVIQLLISFGDIESPKTRLLPKCFTLRTGFARFVTYSPDETRRRCIIRRFLSDVLQEDYGIACAKKI